jgi:hypothetical protein
MLEDGFYSVRFKTGIGQGAGVVVATNGQLLGGDSALAYFGSFTQDGQNNVTASVKTERHTPGIQSVFGRDEVTIALTGKSNGRGAVLTGTSPDAPGVNFTATLDPIDTPQPFTIGVSGIGGPDKLG